jgi:hypothetical protein
MLRINQSPALTRIFCMTAWHSLYLPYADPTSIVETLHSTLQANGYTPYNPFGLVPLGKAYTQTVKAFIAPAEQGWTRVIVAPDTATERASGLARDLSRLVLCLQLSLEDTRAGLSVFDKGETVDQAAALAQYIQTDQANLRTILHAIHTTPVSNATSNTAGGIGGIPLDALGGNVRAMAEGLNPRQAQGLFNRIAGQVLKGDSDKTQAHAARDLLAQGRIEWDDGAGKQIAALMALLSIPSPYWRTSDFVALRDAYALHSRRQRNPNAVLYPGDAEAMHAVSDALRYHPIFAGK